MHAVSIIRHTAASDLVLHCLQISLCFIKCPIKWTLGLYGLFAVLDHKIKTLKAPRKKYLKMSSAEVVCCKYLPNITDEFSIEANSVDTEQTAPI